MKYLISLLLLFGVICIGSSQTNPCEDVDPNYVPYYYDGDGDGYGIKTNSTCNLPGLQLQNWSEVPGDCDDTNPNYYAMQTYYRDIDGDGYGSASSGTEYSCGPSSGYVASSSDCNDNDPSIKPGVADLCGDGVDNNCSGQIDDAIVPSIPNLGSLVEECGVTRLNKPKLPGEIPSDEEWFWQSTSNGTSMSAEASANSISFNFPGTHYLRARSISSECWSDALEIPFTVKEVPPTPDIMPQINQICGLTEITRIADNQLPNGVKWYWQTSPLGIETDSNDQQVYTTSAVSSSSIVYLRAQDTTSLCWSDSFAVTFAVTGNITQTANVASQSLCGQGTLSFTASGATGGQSYRWYDSSGNVLSNDNPFIVNDGISNDYQVALVQNGYCDGPKSSFSATYHTAVNTPTGNNSFARCGPGTVTLTATPGTNANEVHWYSSANGGVVLSIGNSYTTPSISANTTYYAESYNSSTLCFASTRKAIQAQVSTMLTWYADSDGDGFRDPGSVGEQDCADRGTGWTQSTEVDVCPTVSNAQNIMETWYLDADGDGYYVTSQLSCESPGPDYTNATNLQSGDCDDTVPDPNNDCNALTAPSSDPADNNYVYTRTYQESGYTEQNAPTFFTANDDLVQEITYFDGLGRPKQKVGIDQSPDKDDIITHIGYDDYGRMEKEWLPMTDLNQQVGYAHFRIDDREQATEGFYQNKYPSDFLTESNAYSQKKFEPSPLNRVLKQAAPGEDWKLVVDGADNTIGFAYETNSTADNVALFEVTTSFANITYTPTLGENGTYLEGELYKNVTYDENHTSGTDHTTEEFTDKQGRVILKRTYNAGVAHDTYYVYDDFGNLTYVLPPKMEASTESLANINTAMDELGYQYVYDHRNRLVEKKIPGKGWEHIVYNKLDQPIMTQDSIQRQTGEWLFTKYDAFGRVAYTGKAVDTDDREDVQVKADAVTTNLWVDQSGTFSNFGDTDVFYNNGAYPITTLTEVLTINYYDGYVGAPSGAPGSVVVLGTSPQENNITNVKGLATVSKVKVLDVTPAKWITTLTYYDKKARPIYTYSENEYLSTVDIVESKLDFVGKPIQVRTLHSKDGTIVATLDNFTYDHVGRLLKQTQCIGDGTLGYTCDGTTLVNDLQLTGTITASHVAPSSITVSPEATLSGDLVLSIDPNTTTNGGGSSGTEELIAYNDYDELGQLQAKKVGGAPGTDYAGTAGLQTVDYTYNVRGWLKSINNGVATGGDLFGFGVNYNDPQHGATALYNGNISETEWRTVNTDNALKWYRYDFDALNRITSATDNTGNYNLSNITFDKNGNILTLSRQGHTNAAANSFGAMDNLVYSYGTGGNQLTNVADNNASDAYGFKDVNGGGTEYTYDDNGNMTSDANKGITNVTYNHLNLPTQVSFNSGGVINYVYDAAGMKLRKGTSSGTVTEYAGNYIYSGNSSSTALQFFNHAEGYVNVENSGYRYVYQYKDHVDNIRLSYTDDPSNPGTPTIIEESNYYPFGLKHRGYNSGGDTALGNDLAQNWKFGGKEFDETFDINTYDFGARNYMPDIGRWGNIDPLADKFYEHSPYSYAKNNPIFFVDPDGREPIPGPFTGRVIVDKYGTLRAYRITAQQRYVLNVEAAVAGAATKGVGAIAGLINAHNSSEPDWVDRANERAKALVGAGAEGFDSFINSDAIKPFTSKEVGKFAKGLGKGLAALEIGSALIDTDATAQERLEGFTFDFAAALIPNTEKTSREGGLFISGSAGASKENFENDLNAIFLGVSLLTQDFDLTTDQGAADAASFLEENQKLVGHLISFLIQQNQKLEEQNEGQ